MEDKRITEQEGIEVITTMIARTKERYFGNANIMIMWGYLVVLTTIAVWALLSLTHNPAWNWLWFAIPLVGGIATPIMSRKQERKAGVRTYSDIVTSRLWTIVGISAMAAIVLCLGFQLLADTCCWSMMLAYTMIVVPFAEIAQGLVIKEKSMYYGGLTGLAIGLITLCCIAGNIQLYAYWYLPLFIFGFVAMMIVPGHIINHNKSKQ